MPREKVPCYLQAADLLLLTSRSEGSPVVTKEALASNLGIVSVEVGDVAEQLDGVAGCAVTESRPEALAGAVELLLLGPVGQCDGRTRRPHHANENVCG